MIRLLVALALAAAALAQPAAAQDLWRHEASGISLPRQIGELRLGEQQDLSGGGGFDVVLQYGDSDTAVTLYVYRSAFPNPALWFERTRMAMSTNVGAPTEGVSPQSLTLGGASAPNGLREDIAIPTGGRFRATSVAIVQAGEWMFKARISSASRDRAGVAAMMDELLGAARFANMPAPHPLLVPAPCGREAPRNGRRVQDSSPEVLAAAVLSGALAMAQARGSSGLAAEPAAWCREASGIPPQYVTVYRPRRGTGWVALMGDSGRAVAAMPLYGQAGRAATFVSLPGSTSVAALYDGVPDPDSAAVEAAPVVSGRARGLVEIGSSASPQEKPER